jgi:beta-galactosidase
LVLEVAGQGLPPGTLATWLPVLGTGHGVILDDFKDHRLPFAGASLRGLASVIIDDVDVCGCLHWSLTGNYGWFSGYQGHCGLPNADEATPRRSVRPSAVLGGIARADGIA